MVMPAKSWKPSLVSSPQVILLMSTTILSSAATGVCLIYSAATIVMNALGMHLSLLLDGAGDTPRSAFTERGRQGMAASPARSRGMSKGQRGWGAGCHERNWQRGMTLH